MDEPPQQWDRWFGDKSPGDTLVDDAETPPDSPELIDPVAGRQISDQYRVLRTIGSGGMGKVFHGVDERLDRNVAIKLINARGHERAWLQRRFVEEARAMARVRHPNVVEIFAFGEHEENPYFVMEYVDGKNLQDWLASRNGEPLAVDEALGILDQLCRGVSAIHSSGAVHRDIKPANVLVGEGMRVAVTDLGLATKMYRTRSRSHARGGTPGYMAPEIIDGRPVPPDLLAAADVYAVAAIAYELFCGRPAYPGSDPDQIMQAQLAGDPPPPSSVRLDLPWSLDAPILAAMARDPLERTASVEELRQQLLRARSGAHRRQPIRRILLVDDDDQSLRWTGALLRDAFPGATVEAAHDGLEALQHIQAERPDVVVTDLHMPRVSGGELVANLRRDPETRDLPVIVVTGVGGARDWQLLREMGANGFLVKPLDPDALTAMMRRTAGA